LDAVLRAGFQVEAMFAMHMSIPIAEEIFGVYRGVYSSYSKTIEEVCSGPVLALMISGSSSIVEEFRSFCGPLEPELAKVLRPESLRAKFGVNSVRNGVHCTDMRDDGVMEVRYVFETLGNL
jgi:nucleoside-diphosphate kinase